MQNDMTIDGDKISTWFADHLSPEESPYLAINMTKSIEGLKGYNLSDEEKTSIPAITAGYCRLIEEAGWCGWGKTEAEAIIDLLDKR